MAVQDLLLHQLALSLWQTAMKSLASFAKVEFPLSRIHVCCFFGSSSLWESTSRIIVAKSMFHIFSKERVVQPGPEIKFQTNQLRQNSDSPYATGMFPQAIRSLKLEQSSQRKCSTQPSLLETHFASPDWCWHMLAHVDDGATTMGSCQWA